MFDVKKLNKFEMTILSISEKLRIFQRNAPGRNIFENLFSKAADMVIKAADSSLMFPFVITSMYIALNKNYSYIQVVGFSIAAVIVYVLFAGLLFLIAEVPGMIESYIHDLHGRQHRIEMNEMLTKMKSKRQEFNQQVLEFRKKIDEAINTLEQRGEETLSQILSDYKNSLPTIDTN